MERVSDFASSERVVLEEVLERVDESDRLDCELLSEGETGTRTGNASPWGGKSLRFCTILRSFWRPKDARRACVGRTVEAVELTGESTLSVVAGRTRKDVVVCKVAVGER